jgi:hypothetical protein
MNRKLISAICLLSFVILVLGLSRTSRAIDEWLPVPPEDLALKDDPKSPGAHAMILYREEFIDGAHGYEDEYLRIKIFTEEGKDEGNVEIDYLNRQSKITGIRARTIRPDGSVVNFDGQVYDKEILKASGVKISAKIFSLPDVQPGGIIEYKYRREQDFSGSTGWAVQEQLFTRLARFSYRSYLSGAAIHWRKYMIEGDVQPQKQKDGTLTMEVHDLPGIEEEGLMPPEESLRARVSFFYRDVWVPKNETPDQFWQRIGKIWNADEERFIDAKSALRSVVSHTVAANDPPEVKLQKLYARAQQIHNLQYDIEKTAKEVKRDKTKDNSDVEAVLKHGYGTGLEINLLMVGLARAAGFEAALVYIGPRSGIVFYPPLAEINQLSNDIVWIRVIGTDVFVDPSSKFYPYGLMPWYETGVEGLKPTKQGSEFVQVPLNHPQDAVLQRHADVRVESDGTLAGKIQLDYSGIWGCEKREIEREDDDAGRTKDLADDIKRQLPGGAEFEITSISGWDDTSQPLHVEGTIRIPSFATTAGHRILLPVTFIEATEPPNFTHEKRVNPIFFDHPYTKKDSLSIHVAEGFKIESVPPEVKANPGAGFSYGIKAIQAGSTVTIDRQITVDGMIFLAKYYPALRAFFNTVKTGDDTQIVLRPVQSGEAFGPRLELALIGSEVDRREGH